MTTPELDYPEPTQKDLDSVEFNAVWGAIKGWDLSRGADVAHGHLYSGATGNDVMHIIAALRRSQVIN